MEEHTIKILNQYSPNITELNISYKNIKGSLDLSKFTKLSKLNCNNNHITSLYNLPSSLTILYCGSNKITSLDNLPSTLTELNCYGNQIKSLDNLPLTLTELYCDYNLIESLDYLPSSLKILNAKTIKN